METLISIIQKPWPWYITGPLIGLTVPILLLLGNKSFGVSSTLRHICAACIPANITFFKYDWKSQTWNLFFVAGIIIGAYLSYNFLVADKTFLISDETKSVLYNMGITKTDGLLPQEIFAVDQIFTLRGLIFTVLGGFLVGFGTRYAGGCTSGHSIMGISNLQWPSIIATCFFMIGGFISSWLLLPYFLSL